MEYCKIIQDGNIVGAGCNFVCWLPRTRKLAYCDINSAQAVHDAVSEQNYHDSWLKNIPAESGITFLQAEIVLINKDEYDDLIEELMDGEPIPVPDPNPEPEPEPEPEHDSDAEYRMTVQEMREKIAEMEEVLNVIMGVVE